MIAKECWSCDKYQPYYVKKFCHFDKLKYGYCYYHKKQIDDKHSTCEFWCANHITRRIRKDVALRSLNDILTNLTEVGQILKEESEENKINPIE